VTVEDQGSPLANPPHTILDFVGPGVVATDAGGGVAQISVPAFEPARTLFVATAWPADVDPAVYFTTIPAAIAQASALVPAPSQANPVGIIIYPGVYPQNIVMPSSGVGLMGANGTFPQVQITGTVTWTPTGNVTEVAWFYFLRIANTITVDTTGKTGGQTSMHLTSCFTDRVLYTGRSAAGATRDLFQSIGSIGGPPPNPWTFSSAEIVWTGGRLDGMTFNGACQFAIVGAETVPTGTIPWNVNGTSTGSAIGCVLTAPWNIGDSAFCAFAGSYLTQPLTVAVGASADVRGANYNGNANLVGPGPINRTTHTQSFGPTVAGANAVAFAVPFPDGAYNVSLQLTAGPGNAAVTVTGKTGAGFTINDAVGGNTYDVIVSHD
jgi:hypothetical protein